jgi:hypothetical protein
LAVYLGRMEVRRKSIVLGGFCLAVIAAPATAAEPSATELAKAVQTPVADLIGVPFQNNTKFNYGWQSETQNALNIQPVIPVGLYDGWSFITRTILPVITQACFVPGQASTTGLGDIQLTAFPSPAKAHGLIWGVGSIVQLPTNTNDRLGNDSWAPARRAWCCGWMVRGLTVPSSATSGRWAVAATPATTVS